MLTADDDMKRGSLPLVTAPQRNRAGWIFLVYASQRFAWEFIFDEAVFESNEFNEWRIHPAILSESGCCLTRWRPRVSTDLTALQSHDTVARHRVPLPSPDPAGRTTAV